MDVVTAPDSRLKIQTKSIKKVTPAIVELGREMIKITKTFTDPEGVGLAATQIGREEAIFVAKIGKKFSIFINPKILSYGKKQKVFFEGCLSIPNFWGEVRRPTTISVEYINEAGESVKESLKGVPAWIFQHEVDHLNGRLFVDHVMSQKSKMFKVVGKDQAGSDVFEEIKYALSA